MRSVALSCPGCFATYEARFSGAEMPAFTCRFCHTLLEEVAWEPALNAHSPDQPDVPQLTVTQYPVSERLIRLDE